MHYFIDGYNLLFRSVDVEKSPFQALRQSLVHTLDEHVSGLQIDVTVVFDSQFTPEESVRSHFRHLEIIYSHAGLTADDLIIRLLQRCQSPHLETIVTSDKDLALKARNLGAKVVGVSEFMHWLSKRQLNLSRSKRPKQSKLIKPLESKKTTAIPAVEKPVEKKLPEGSLEYYLSQFEKQLEAIEPPPKVTKQTPIRKPKKKKRDLSQSGGGSEASTDHFQGLTEEERWQKIFESKSEPFLF